MPSFSKPATTDNMNSLAGLWKDQSNTSPLEDLLAHHRTRAIQILGTEMPAKILHIRSMIALESDPSSILWRGHVNEGDFVRPRMMQPDSLSKLLAKERGLVSADLKEGEDIFQPTSQMKSGGINKSNLTLHGAMEEPALSVAVDNEHIRAESDQGSVKDGPYGFEVVPRNKIQADLVILTTKEHEDLHSMVQDLRVWLELEIPLIEDGNSFGAEVQNHLINQLETAYKKSNGFINSCRQHHSDRMRFMAGWIKNPNVMDYSATISNSDRFDNFLSHSYLPSLLMIYGGLMMRFKKNWEKVINPKGSSNGGAGGIY